MEMKMSNTRPIFGSDEEKKWLNSALHSGNVEVEFEKKDGTMRKMICTLLETTIPTEKLPKGAKKTQNFESLAVFDTEKQEWRSFTVKSVKRVHFDL